MRKIWPVLVGFCVITGSFLVILTIVEERAMYFSHALAVERSIRNLKVGMDQAEIDRIVPGPPDFIGHDTEVPGIAIRSWSPGEHKGGLHRFFGIDPEDPKNYTDLILKFDTSGRLLTIYHGG